MTSPKAEWGVELWDKYEDVHKHVSDKSIDFMGNLRTFFKSWHEIEVSYAKALKKLVEKYDPKGKKKHGSESEVEWNYNGGFFKFIPEANSIANQHQTTAEKFETEIVGKLRQRKQDSENKLRTISKDASLCKTELDKKLRDLRDQKSRHEHAKIELRNSKKK